MFVVYGNKTCGWCNKAVDLIKQYDLPLDYRNTDDMNHLNELKTRLPDVKSIPQIWWQHVYIGGYEQLATYIEQTYGGYGQGSF